MKRFVADRSGATAIEYALIASLISVMLIGGASSIGVSLDGMFTALQAAFS